MSNSSVLLRPFEGYHARSRVAGITEVGRNAVPVIDRLSDHATVRNALLDCYLEGWAEANVVKIFAAISSYQRAAEAVAATECASPSPRTEDLNPAHPHGRPAFVERLENPAAPAVRREAEEDWRIRPQGEPLLRPKNQKP
jgi:hypothetical protein